MACRFRNPTKNIIASVQWMPALYLSKTSVQMEQMFCFHAYLIKISNSASSEELLFKYHIHDECLLLSCRLFRLYETYAFVKGR